MAAEAAAKKRRELSSCVLSGGKDAGAADPHADEKARLRAEMAAGRGTAYFVHIQNAGGTSMCKMAQRNGLAAPQESPEESGVFGRNCNPSSAEAKRIWKGDVAAQRAWRQGSSYRFVANEMALPPQLAFGDFLYVVVVRWLAPLTLTLTLALTPTLTVTLTNPIPTLTPPLNPHPSPGAPPARVGTRTLPRLAHVPPVRGEGLGVAIGLG